MANIKELIESIESGDSSFDEKLEAINKMEDTLVAMRQQEEEAINDNVELIVEAIKVMENKVSAQLEIAKSIVPEKGDKGDKGADGKQGKDGRDGKDGKDGKNGKDGKDGKDGVSVTDAKIDFDGSLVITLSTGKELNVGEVVAPDLAEKIKVINTMSTNGAVAIKDEGTSISTGVKSINFVGATVTATNSGDDVVVNVSAGTGTVTSVGLSGGTTGLTASGSPITTTGTITLGGTLAVANGGTGATTASAAFNALSPVTTTGDLIIGNGTNSATRLAIGANTYVLTSNGTTATWSAPSGGSMVYPGAGIAVSTGSAWTTSLTAPTGTIVGTTDTQTLTNKTITQRVVTITDGTSITINADTTDVATQANTQAAGSLTINAPTGTPVNGQKFILRLSSTSIQTFSWNAIFAGSTDLALPTVSTGSGKYDYVGFIYNSTATKWQLLAKVFGF